MRYIITFFTCLLLLTNITGASCSNWKRSHPAKTHQQASHDGSAEARLFNDLQNRQMGAARKLGIKPLDTDAGIKPLVKKGKLVKVSNCKAYKIAGQQYGYPYLVPKAATLLQDIGQGVQKRSGTNSRIIATSELRTKESVRRLQRGNINAVTNSCHMYGTTFDISYEHFDRKGKTTDQKLYKALVETLKDLRSKGRCYVKYECKQHCFHITVRK